LPGRIQRIPFAIRLMLAAMHDLNLYLATAHELAPAMEMIGWLRCWGWAFCGRRGMSTETERTPHFCFGLVQPRIIRWGTVHGRSLQGKFRANRTNALDFHLRKVGVSNG
jgi:hypothetical protein